MFAPRKQLTAPPKHPWRPRKQPWQLRKQQWRLREQPWRLREQPWRLREQPAAPRPSRARLARRVARGPRSGVAPLCHTTEPSRCSAKLKGLSTPPLPSRPVGPVPWRSRPCGVRRRKERRRQPRRDRRARERREQRVHPQGAVAVLPVTSPPRGTNTPSMPVCVLRSAGQQSAPCSKRSPGPATP